MRFSVFIAVASLLAFASLQPGNSFAGSAVLRWHATGDDSIIGRATAYDLRYSTNPITTTNFGSAIGVPSLPPPASAGTPESFIVSGLNAGTIYYFALKARDDVGNWSNISNVIYKTAVTTLEADDATAMISFSPPRPNPARSGSLFVMRLPVSTKVQVEAFDISGRRVRTLADQTFEAGDHPVRWDLYDEHGNRLSPGIYKVRARIGSTSFTRTLAVVQ